MEFTNSKTITNEKILKFYETNPELNIENVNLYFIELLKNTHYSQINSSSINELFLKNNFNKEFLNNENKLHFILSNICLMDNVVKNKNMNIHCDFIINSHDKPTIFIESKETPINIDSDVTNVFINSLKKHNSCGIFISQYSGIIQKPNFKIEIYNGNILIYISNCHYDINKIKYAIEIIYSLYDTITLFNNSESSINNSILLTDCNNEYQIFLNNKENIIKMIKENTNSVVKQIDKCNFETLNKYLSTKFISQNQNNNIHKCSLCNVYFSKSLKGIAAHKKGCIKKYKQNYS